MRNLHNIRIIAVDHSYGNVKTANTITPTSIKASPTKPIFYIQAKVVTRGTGRSAVAAGQQTVTTATTIVSTVWKADYPRVETMCYAGSITP